MNLQPTIEESPIASHCKVLKSRGKPLGMLLTGALWILFQVYWWGLAARNSAFGIRRLDLCRLVTSLISTSSIGFLPRGKCQRLHPPRVSAMAYLKMHVKGKLQQLKRAEEVDKLK